jgi:hypothetical protein
MAVWLALQLSKDVRLYFVMNQANILQTTELGFSVRICLYDCLKATGMRLRKALMRAEFMMMTLLCRLSAMLWVTLTLEQSLVSAHPL